MDRSHVATALFALCVLPVSARGQNLELPTPEKYAERAAKAEAATLLQAHDLLEMTLTTDIDWLRARETSRWRSPVKVVDDPEEFEDEIWTTVAT